jgi:flagellar biogenesis protein FliO
MSAKTIAAALPDFPANPLLVEHLRNAGRWLAQRFSSRAHSAERVLAIEDRVVIGPKKSLVVVRCHGQRFLIATAGDSIGPVIEVAAAKPARRTRREREA